MKNIDLLLVITAAILFSVLSFLLGGMVEKRRNEIANRKPHTGDVWFCVSDDGIHIRTDPKSPVIADVVFGTEKLKNGSLKRTLEFVEVPKLRGYVDANGWTVVDLLELDRLRKTEEMVNQ
jgi:hypothetical protein